MFFTNTASMLGVSHRLESNKTFLTNRFIDYAAGEFIVREAGGYTCDPAGGPLDLMSRRCIATSTKELADEVISHLVQYYPEPRDD